MRVYADYNATAPLRPEARAAMVDAMDWIGNPSSAHRDGARVRRAIEDARGEVAALVDRAARDVVFTSGATEANVLAMMGTLERGDRLVTSVVEHASILDTSRRLEEEGVHVVRVAVADTGEIDAEAMIRALATGPALVSLGYANGEVGTVLAPDVLEALATHASTVHLDLAQALGRVVVPASPRSMLALSAHKLGGPTGVGALVVPPGTRWKPLSWGGTHERGRRAGTENVLGIVGFGAAARVVRKQGAEEVRRVEALRDTLWNRLCSETPGLRRNGPPSGRGLPNMLNVTVPGLSGDAVLMRLDLAGVSASLGSACAAGSPEPSHVLRAMGRDEEAARAGLRISLGWASRPADVDVIASAVTAAARGARAWVAA